jgi:hypothetical protein
MNTENPLNPGSQPDKQTTEPAGIVPEAERQLKEDAGKLAETAKRDLDKIRGEAESTAHEIAEQARAQLGQAADKVKGMASEQKDFLAGQLESVATAVSRVADELSTEEAASAGYARSIADGMRRFSDTVRTRNVDELVHLAEDFGRRQPVAFMGAAALAGFAASRFLFASASRRNVQADAPMQTGADFGSSAPTYPDGGELSAQRQPREPMGGIR